MVMCHAVVVVVVVVVVVESSASSTDVHFDGGNSCEIARTSQQILIVVVVVVIVRTAGVGAGVGVGRRELDKLVFGVLSGALVGVCQ